MREAFLLVRQHSRATFARMKRQYDAGVREKDFRVGQYVLFYYPRRYRGRSPKLARHNVGPYRIIRRLNAVNFVIALTARSRHMVVHVDKLRPWHGDEPRCWVGVPLPVPALEVTTSPLGVGVPPCLDAVPLPREESVPEEMSVEVAEQEDLTAPEVDADSTSPSPLTRPVPPSRIPRFRRQPSTPAPVREGPAVPVTVEKPLPVSSTLPPKRVVVSQPRGDGRPRRTIRRPRRYQNQ